MATVKLTAHQTAFIGGEIAPRLLARTDLKTYTQSAKTLTNALPFYQGGVNRRPGTFFHHEVRNSSFAVKLIPFVYSRTQSYICEFNNSYIRFIKNGDYIESSPGVPYEIAHPFLSDELNEIRIAQFQNTVYFTHPNHAPKRLIRTSDTNWSFANIPFVYKALSSNWYENKNIRFKIITNSVTYTAGSTFTINSPGGGGVPATPTFTGAGYGFMVVSSKAGSPAETWTVTCTYADSLVQEWQVTGSVSGVMMATFYTGNYPAAISFYQQRMFLAGTPNEPQTLWGSKTADFTNFSRGTGSDDGLELTLANSSNDMILHLVSSSKNMLIMSYANEFILEATNGVLSPATAIVTPQTRHGCNLVSPVGVGKVVLFAQRNGRRLRGVEFAIESGQNLARDVTLYSEHILGDGGVIDMSFQQDPGFTVWCIRHDGKMASLTYLDEQEVIAWAKHETGNDDGWFKAVATIPENQSDRTYLVVERLVNGIYKKYVESIDYLYESFSDSTIFGSSVTAKKTWTGFGHLEGKLVHIVGDGSYQTPKTVVGGSITLDNACFEIAVGLPYTTTIELLHPTLDINGNTTQGKQLSIYKVTLELNETIGVEIDGDPEPMSTFKQKLNHAPVPFTGNLSRSLTGWSSPNYLLIEQKLPMPFTLLGVISELTVTT